MRNASELIYSAVSNVSSSMEEDEGKDGGERGREGKHTSRRNDVELDHSQSLLCCC